MSRILSVLIIEDNPADVYLIRKTLPETGSVRFQIEPASRLSEGLARLKNGGIELVLLDLKLPDSQGLETFRRLQAAASDIPTIILTSNDDQETAVAAVREGAQDYLVKGQAGGSLLARAALYAVERKQAEIRLKESQARYQAIFEATGTATLIVEEDTTIKMANNECLPVSGYTPEELIGTKWIKYVAPESLEIMLKYHKLRREEPGKAPRKYEVRLLNKNGEIRNVILDIGMIPDTTQSIVSLLDITSHKQEERRQFLVAEIMSIINESSSLVDTINRILISIKREMGFEAVGIRLQSGEDFPYFVQNGFSHDFLRTENTLTVRDQDGGICRDENGNISLECTCGLVLSGRTDPTNPLITQGGSFWTNDSLPLLDLPADQDPRLHPRNRCIHEGFLSVALIPIRANQEIVGLLQLNNRKKDCFTLDMIHYFEGLGTSIGIALSRKQAEEALHESEERYHSLFENMLEGYAYCKMIFDHDTPQDFIYIDVNIAFEKLTGLRHVVGKKVSQVIPGIQESNPELFQIYGRVSLTGKPERFEMYLGSLGIWFSVAVYSTEKEYFIAVFDNITERKQAEEELKETLESLRKAIGTTIQVLTLAVETRDPYTAGHQRRATDLARAIAAEMGLPQHTIRASAWQALYMTSARYQYPQKS